LYIDVGAKHLRAIQYDNARALNANASPYGWHRNAMIGTTSRQLTLYHGNFRRMTMNASLHTDVVAKHLRSPDSIQTEDGTQMLRPYGWHRITTIGIDIR